MREIAIKGFSTKVVSDCKPAVVVFGEANSGTTRFGTTAPHDEGYIGWIAIDRNSKLVVEEQQALRDLPIIANDKPVISHKDSMRLALLEDVTEVKKIYSEALANLFEQATALAAHPNVQSIVIDRVSQVFDMILFAHFGRKNQIETFQRGAPNQDMIDLINALSHKNLVLCCKNADVWKDTGEVDKNGKKKQAPTGKQTWDGYKQIDRFVTATVELTSLAKKFPTPEDEEDRKKVLDEKYRLKVVRCKGNTLYEGTDLADMGVCGEGITWQNLMLVLGQE